VSGPNWPANAPPTGNVFIASLTGSFIGASMNSTLFTGIAMICAGKLQQGAGWLIGSRKHQILGFDRELCGKTAVALSQADHALRMSPQLIPVRIQQRRRDGNRG
jgi:hypothetical protein